MISILKMRLLHWKKQVFTLLFWLLFPIIATISLVYITSIVQEDSEIPVGIVMEEDTPLANELLVAIDQTPFIRTEVMSENEALLALEAHELDSVFIIREGYEEQIENGSRNRLLMSYRSDLSFAYTPVSEMVISHVQQDTGRSKAAYTVMELSEAHQQGTRWTWEEVVDRSKQVEAEEDLLQTAFSFQGHVPASTEDNISLLDTWGLWSVFSLLTALLLFDWLIKERNNNLYPRFVFFRMSFKLYLILNGLIYTLLFLLFDFITLFIFHMYLGVDFSWHFLFILITYRFMLNTGVFAFTLLFKYISLFYTVAFAMTLLIAIISGSVLPTEGLTIGLPWLEVLNPFNPFLNGEMSFGWFVIFLVPIGIWFFRKEKQYA
ncbi:ABC transporter permease [Virgibacillus kimchii]